MAKTSAERQQEFIDNLKKNGQYDQYLAKKKAQMKLSRERTKLRVEQMPEEERVYVKAKERVAGRMRIARYRSKKAKKGIFMQNVE